MTTDPTTLPYLLTSRQLADLLQVSTKNLENMRARGQVPVPLKIGRRLRWRRDLVLSWLGESHTPRTTFKGGQR